MLAGIINLLPRFMQRKLLLKKVDYDFRLPDGIVFKPAENQAEIEAALEILHDSYVDQNLMNPQKGNIRITKYHILPTTSILVVKLRGEVIGTMSIIMDSAFGLPLEELWGLDHLRKKYSRLCEVRLYPVILQTLFMDIQFCPDKYQQHILNAADECIGLLQFLLEF